VYERQSEREREREKARWVDECGEVRETHLQVCMREREREREKERERERRGRVRR